MNRKPLFLSLALFSWLFAMLAPSLEFQQPTFVLLCAVAMPLAVLWRMKGLALPMAASLLFTALAMLPAVFFLLARSFMGDISSSVFYGLLGLCVSLPLDSALSPVEQSRKQGPEQGRS